MATPTSRFTQTGLLDRVRGDLGLRSANLLTDTELAYWGVEAQDIAARETRWYKTSAYVNAVSGTKEYDLPSGCLAIEEVNFSTSGTAGTHLPMRLVTLSDLYEQDLYWRSSSTGTPLFYYLRGVTSYGLHSTPGTSITNGIQVVYVGLPTAPSAGGDFYAIPYGAGECIIAYVLWRASMKDATGEGGRRVDTYYQRWQQSLNDLKRQVESTSEGEACVLGEAGEARGLGWYDGFNPNNVIVDNR